MTKAELIALVNLAPKYMDHLSRCSRAFGSERCNCGLWDWREKVKAIKGKP